MKAIELLIEANTNKIIMISIKEIIQIAGHITPTKDHTNMVMIQDQIIHQMQTIVQMYMAVDNGIEVDKITNNMTNSINEEERIYTFLGVMLTIKIGAKVTSITTTISQIIETNIQLIINIITTMTIVPIIITIGETKVNNQVLLIKVDSLELVLTKAVTKIIMEEVVVIMGAIQEQVPVI